MRLLKSLAVLTCTLLLLGCEKGFVSPRAESVIATADAHRRGVIVHTRAASYSVFPDTDDVAKLKDPTFLEAIQAESPMGSAFGVSADGLVLTNMHVIEGTNFCTARGSGEGAKRSEKKKHTYCTLVTQEGKKVYRAKLVTVDEENDIAVLRIEGSESGLPFLRLAKEGTFEDGAEVLTVGNPLGNMNVMTHGYISNLRFVTPDKLGDKNGARKVQFSAAILPGNSGGPLVSVATGEVVGQVVAIIIVGRGIPTQMSYANPVEFLKKSVQATPKPKVGE